MIVGYVYVLLVNGRVSRDHPKVPDVFRFRKDAEKRKKKWTRFFGRGSCRVQKWPISMDVTAKRHRYPRLKKTRPSASGC